MEKHTNSALLYEPRMLFGLAARQCIEAQGYTVIVIPPSEHGKELFARNTKNVLLLIGLAGAGQDLFSLLRIIHQMTALGSNVIVWLPEHDELLAQLLYGLGVRSLLCDVWLEEELPQRLTLPNYTSSHLPQWNAFRNRYPRSKLSANELETLIDFCCGMNSQEIASLRRCSYKTVFTHKRNAQQRLMLKNVEWLDLICRLADIRTL